MEKKLHNSFHCFHAGDMVIYEITYRARCIIEMESPSIGVTIIFPEMDINITTGTGLFVLSEFYIFSSVIVHSL